MTIIFGIYNQPRKTTRYTKKLKLVWGGGGGIRKSPFLGLKIQKTTKKLKNIIQKIEKC